ncbi:LAFE_0C13630g1_1 [Lachancea fermentati]|uniref:LAFE_0C13630g1_1 n=1 Tax=Lachancea fermentati TaxID=4955 RepID=A0A1G4MAJ4_LACFM|nr:LAFE_0C13630g1_1 [Lachancea fermentati]
MDANVSESLVLALEISSKRKLDDSLINLPLFKEINEQNAQAQERKQWGQMKNKQEQANRTRSRFMPPLAAYTAEYESPAYSFVDGESAAFDGFEMKSNLNHSKLAQIRMLGWNNIKPIGIGRTAKELDEAQRMIRQQEEKQNEDRRSHQGNRVEDNHTDPPQITSYQENSYAISPPDMDFDLDQGVQEEDNSYDYDDEYARVEQEVEIQTNPRQDQHQRAGTSVSVQQFVETSHVDGINHPYAIEQDYNNGYGYSDDGQEDSGDGDLTLMPPVNISDTVDYDDDHSEAQIPTIRILRPS